MKLCKDCKYHSKPFYVFSEFAACLHDKNVNPVTGDSGLYCKLAREFDNNCGRNAAYWESNK